ncbi:hypothetical protein [Phocaeicola coprocola]|uniref:hypothetical protein n=1 Tax=Phocaeicola coprocola TaxID=310298 RepID=UPI00242DC850|nr:hypothetical protein [Phocaeicola coprocola]
MAFPFQKIRCAVGGCRMLFPLSPAWVVRHAVMVSCCHVVVSACRHDGMSAYVISLGLPCHFPTDLLMYVKALSR